MDLTIDLGVIVNSGIFALLVYHVKTVQDLVKHKELHNWRITRLEKKADEA